jgi:hypothetical protein
MPEETELTLSCTAEFEFEKLTLSFFVVGNPLSNTSKTSIQPIYEKS